MTLRTCPEHGELLEEVHLLVCPYFHMTSLMGKRLCLHTEPLPPQQEMEQVEAERLLRMDQ